MRRIFFIFSFCALPCFGAIAEDELLHIRRIETLWQEKDLSFLKKHILEFRQQFPKSPSNSRFSAMLGDIAFAEKNHQEALHHYEEIEEDSLKKSIQVKKWHCQYLLGKYSDLTFEITPPVLKQSDDAKFYYANACFREGIVAEKGTKVSKLFDEALTYLEILEGHPFFSEQVKLTLAEIHTRLGHVNAAKKYYLELADNLEGKEGPAKEAALLQAAFALRNHDPSRAKKISSHLARFGLKVRKEAAELWLHLLIKNHEWDQIALHESTLLASLAKSKKHLCHRSLAKIYFEKREWERAIHHFEQSELQKSLPEAISYLKVGNHRQALQIVEELLKESPDDQKAIFLKAYLLCQEKRWEEAFQIARSLNSEEASLLRVKAILGMKEIDYLLLASSLEKSQHGDPLLKLILAECYLARNQKEKGETLLLELAEKDDFEAEALLSTLCSERGESRGEILHGEKALYLDEDHPLSAKLHLHLFNAYLKLAQEEPDCEYATMAAQHLYLGSNKEPITLENRLWLAHHFVKKYGLAFDDRDAWRAVSILEPLCGDVHAFERETLDLASLYESLRETEKCRELLLKVIEAQEKHPELNWKYKEKSKLLLADLHQRSGEIKEACTLYRSLEHAHDPKIGYTATLHLARIIFANLGEEEKKESNPKVQQILARLKEIKSKRQLVTEPVHLEAAIDSAEFLGKMAQDHARDKVLLAHLIQVKTEFSSEDDIASKDYHLGLELMPDKGRLFSAYMRYLDARICQLQSIIAKREGNLIESRTKEKAAFALFSSLKQGKYAVTPYIKEKSEIAMK